MDSSEEDSYEAPATVVIGANNKATPLPPKSAPQHEVEDEDDDDFCAPATVVIGANKNQKKTEQPAKVNN